jgi:hypothetical protein
MINKISEWHNQDMEFSILGAVLIRENKMMDISFLKPKHFYFDNSRTVFQEMLLLKGKGEPIDTLLIIESLKKRKKLEEIGGSYFITGLPDYCTTPEKAKYHGEKVVEYWEKRQKRILGQKINRGDEIDIESELSKINEKPNFRNFPNFQGVSLDWKRLTPATLKYLEIAYNTSDAPDEFILISLLTHWAGMVGSKVNFKGMRPNIWAVIFAKSSEIRKTQSFKIGGKPFKNIQNKFDGGYIEAEASHKTELREWENLSKDQKRDIPKPEPPQHVKLLLDVDFSDAGFYEMLKHNPLAGTVVTAEFADFNKKIKRDYTNQANALLSAYDGDRMSRITRTHGTEIIQNPAFSILGATTFKNFVKEFTATETENGFLQRIFPTVILERTKKRKLFLKMESIENIFNDYENMAMNWFRYDGDMETEITDEIDKSFCNWEERFIKESIAKHGANISPHVERMVPGCLKLCMLLQSLEHETPPEKLIISHKVLDCSIMIVENFFLPSLVYLLENEIIFDKNIFDEKLVEKTIIEAGGVIDRKDLMRETRFSKNRLDFLIETMAEKGMIEEQEFSTERSQSGGRHKKVYTWLG